MDTETNVQSFNPPAPPIPILEEQGSDIDPIRTETVFSRLPLHILSKNGPRPEISFTRRTADGKIEEKWDVSYNEKHGAARQLAYDVHTLVIERAIEEAFEEARRTSRPFPRYISLKSLNDIAHRLGAETAETRNTNRIKKALQQNAGILIDCFIKFRGSDGSEYTLQGTFSPYGIFFVGQKLPDGSTASEVLANLNDPYFEAWSKSPSRPLDYTYKAKLPPTSRRFYELISYAMYGAIKNNQPTARYRYSEYCRRAPQMRYQTFDEVKKQMHKVHKPHRDAGYITKVHYEQTAGEQGTADWWMIYNPGPRAYAEYSTFSGKKVRIAGSPQHSLPAGERFHRSNRPRQGRLDLAPTIEPQPARIIDYRAVAELTKRGVEEVAARSTIAELPPDFPLLDTLEWADQQISANPRKWDNPPGFYIRLLQKRSTPPPTFETSSARKTRQAAEIARAEAVQKEQQAQQEAQEVENRLLDQLLTGLSAAEQHELFKTAKAEMLSLWPGMAAYFAAHTEAHLIAEGPVRARMKKQLSDRKPHQTIKPPTRQADPLQETPPVLSEASLEPVPVTAELQPVAEAPQATNPLPDLQAILTTPQLSPADVEQGSVKPAPPATPSVKTDPQ